MSEQENKPQAPELPSQEELLRAAEGTPDQEEAVEPQAPEGEEAYSAEKEALSLGWTTKEDWVKAGRNPRDWRPAEAWLDRGQILGTLSSLRKELASTRSQVGAAYEMGRKMAEQAFKEELDALKKEKREALSEHDLLRADEIQERIDEHQSKAAVEIPKPAVDFTPPPEYDLFIQRNPWYLTDPMHKASAEAVAAVFVEHAKRTGKQATPADLYFFVETKMREKYGDLLGKSPNGPKPPKAPAVEAGGKQGQGSAPAKGGLKPSLATIKSGLNEFERSIMRNIINSTKGMTEEKYLEEYSKVK